MRIFLKYSFLFLFLFVFLACQEEESPEPNSDPDPTSTQQKSRFKTQKNPDSKPLKDTMDQTPKADIKTASSALEKNQQKAEPKTKDSSSTPINPPAQNSDSTDESNFFLERNYIKQDVEEILNLISGTYSSGSVHGDNLHERISLNIKIENKILVIKLQYREDIRKTESRCQRFSIDEALENDILSINLDKRNFFQSDLWNIQLNFNLEIPQIVQVTSFAIMLEEYWSKSIVEDSLKITTIEQDVNKQFFDDFFKHHPNFDKEIPCPN